MFEVRHDEQQNVLRVAFTGRVDLTAAREWRREMEARLAEIAPGFRLLTDLSELEEMELACAEEIRAVMDVLRARGVVQVVRVVSDPWKDIGFMTMSRFHFPPNISMQTVETRAEAERLLAD